MKWFVKLIIGIVVFIVISAIVLLITGIILINMTPNKLKVGDKTIINGKSCNDLGIGDVKIKTMISDFNDIKDKKNVVTNPYDASKAKLEMDPIFEKFNLIKDDNYDYEKLFATGLDGSSSYYYEYSDTTVAYILNNSISYFQGDAETITDFKFEISEVSFYGDKKEMRVAYKVDISEFKKKLENAIPSFISRFIGMPKSVYLVCYYDVEVTSEGTLDLDYKNIFINDVDTDFSNAILRSISTENNSLEEYGESLGDAISSAISFLGKVGVASVNDAHEIVSGSESIGIDGYKNGKIGMICGN